MVVKNKKVKSKQVINYDTLPVRPTSWLIEHMFEKGRKKDLKQMVRNESISSRKASKKRR